MGKQSNKNNNDLDKTHAKKYQSHDQDFDETFDLLLFLPKIDLSSCGSLRQCFIKFLKNVICSGGLNETKSKYLRYKALFLKPVLKLVSASSFKN